MGLAYLLLEGLMMPASRRSLIYAFAAATFSPVNLRALAVGGGHVNQTHQNVQ